MKTIRTLTAVLAALTLGTMNAQEMKTMQKTDAAQEEQMLSSETTEKTYTVYKGDKVMKNGLKINTVMTQALMLDPEDKGKVNQDQVVPKKKIYKAVKLDNDNDPDYDELIKFSYMAYNDSDFVLITDQDEVYVALEEGENLRILSSTNIYKNKLSDDKTSYVFVDDNGKRIEFYIESYELL